jgi:light-regulated signal transduction histidine kinase (bacteriophytochrome)
MGGCGLISIGKLLHIGVKRTSFSGSSGRLPSLWEDPVQNPPVVSAITGRNYLESRDLWDRVQVTLDREESHARIVVRDNGQGIEAALLPDVFDRYRQADSSTRRKLGGLGLGLSIVKHIAEQHGGTVEASRDGEGCGATFIVRVPIQAVRISARRTNADASEERELNEQAAREQQEWAGSEVRLGG